MKHEVILGRLPDEESKRDAVHVAVIPMVAVEKLHAGQGIRRVIGTADRAQSSIVPVAIVDPFLKQPVYEGQRFWALLLPGTTTAVRHEWEHPSFEPDIIGAEQEKDDAPYYDPCCPKGEE